MRQNTWAGRPGPVGPPSRSLPPFFHPLRVIRALLAPQMVAGAVDTLGDSEKEEATSRWAGPSREGPPTPEAHTGKDAKKRDDFEHDEVLDWEEGAAAPCSEPASGPCSGQTSPKLDPFGTGDPQTRDRDFQGRQPLQADTQPEQQQQQSQQPTSSRNQQPRPAWTWSPWNWWNGEASWEDWWRGRVINPWAATTPQGLR